MVIVGTNEEEPLVAIIFEFCTNHGRDHACPSRDHAYPGRDICSGYVLEVFFILEQFGHDRDKGKRCIYTPNV